MWKWVAKILGITFVIYTIYFISEAGPAIIGRELGHWPTVWVSEQIGVWPTVILRPILFIGLLLGAVFAADRVPHDEWHR